MIESQVKDSPKESLKNAQFDFAVKDSVHRNNLDFKKPKAKKYIHMIFQLIKEKNSML